MRRILTTPKPGRRALIAAGVVLLLGALLWLDLRGRGAAWNVFWSLTGEEEPLPQIRGIVEWAGNFLRPQPRTEPLTPIQHADVNPYGINTFLQQEVEIPKRERTLQMIAEAGFTMIRQQFPWADIEIHGRGDFIDRRNDLNGDGQPDAVDAWAKYDNILDLAEQYGITIQARLDNPPPWTHADPAIGDFAPPDDVQDFVNYAIAVATRYRGRIRYYQIWNEPNIYPEWGEQAVNPEAYTDLLCQTYTALKAVDPEIVVISGPLSPTVSLTERNLNDFIFLQRMYDAGAGACFDVMSAQGYGFYSGPTDRRLHPLTLTYARHLYIRDLMVANGDAHKAIWISEAAWNPQPEDPAVVTSQYGNFGIVTEEQAARYMPLAYQRALAEWPWIGNISYWFFKRPADYERQQAFYYFRMVEPDFTPLPVYDSMKQYITTQTPVLYPGVHQAEDWAIHLGPEDIDVRSVEGAEFGRSWLVIYMLNLHIHGTDISLRWRSSDSIGLEVYQSVDNELQLLTEISPLSSDEWHQTSIRLSTWAGQHIIGVAPKGSESFIVDSITVVDRTYENVYPYAAMIGIALGMMVLVVVNALRERRR